MKKLRHKLKEIGFFSKHRYWSIMLVGEHGRVIPVRRFKTIAFAITALALFSSLALVVLGAMHVQQGRTVDHLQSELERLQQHANLLRDEKDMLKARMVIGSLQSATASNLSGPETQKGVELKSLVQESPPVIKKPEADKTTTAQSAVQKASGTKWQAVIKQLEMRYDFKDKVLKAQCVIHNMSKPKDMLSGRTILVLKSGDDPIDWISVPQVPFKDGKPSGQGGHAFTVRNYRTLNFTATQQKVPDTFKRATVYVFLESGELLLARDFDVKVTVDGPSPEEQVRQKEHRAVEPAIQSGAPAEAQSSPDEGTQEGSGDNGQEESQPADDAPGVLPQNNR